MTNLHHLYTDRARLAFLHGPTYTGAHYADYTALQAQLVEAETTWARDRSRNLARIGDALPPVDSACPPAVVAPDTFISLATVCANCHRTDRRVLTGETLCLFCKLLYGSEKATGNGRVTDALP